MAIDWGQLAGAVLSNVANQVGGTGGSAGASVGPLPAGTSNGSGYYTTTATRCRRRRRRRLLTPTDLSDLAALQALVGKGDTLKMAVAKAVRR